MDFRKIYPSTSHLERFGPQLAGSDSYGLRGKVDAGITLFSSAKRRRVPQAVTKNACLNCKKARAKCDGSEPCKRCASRVDIFECVYETNLKHAKEDLIKNINQLKEQIKELLVDDHLTKQILCALSTDEKVPEILDKLQNGSGYKNIVEWLDCSAATEFEAPSPTKMSYSISEVSDYDIGNPGPAFEMWTSVTSDTATIYHLLQLYFAHIHPVHTLFDKDRFFDSHKRHLKDFCSSTLLNALCAMACNLPTIINDSGINFAKLGLQFSESVKAEIDAEDRAITTIQAFAVMFLVDLSHSNALRAASYLKTASSILVRVEILEVNGFQEVWYDTVRGLHNLTVEWAQMTFHVPPNIDMPPPVEIESPNEFNHLAISPYPRSSSAPPERSSLLATINSEKSTLIGIIEDVVTMMYSERGPQITAVQVLREYDRLITWRDGLSSTIARRGSEASQESPHVLSLLILYSNSVVQLLRPLLDLEGFSAAIVEDTIRNNAQQGLLLVEEHYQSAHAGQYQPTLQLFAALHLIDVLARFFPHASGQSKELGVDAIRFGCRMLIQSRDKYPVAAPFHDMLQRTANECGISLLQDTDKPMTADLRSVNIYREDDLIDACTRHTYVQPVTEIHTKYSSSFSAEWASYVASFGFQSALVGGTRVRVASIDEMSARPVMDIRNFLNVN